ncbi:MAG: type II toxin-antitoxin system RelB/DinJ family antitoxin [Hydrogenoanaerobacterium sp.]
MAQTNVSIRMDEDLKKQFDVFCSDVGMNMTTAINIFAKMAVRERRIPFEISAAADPFYSESNMNHLKKVVSDIETGRAKFVVKSMEELETMEND